MYPLGHYGLALLVAAPATLVLSRRRSALLTCFALVVTMLPDMDIPLSFTHHHGGMHTVVFAVLGSVGVGLAFTALAALVRLLVDLKQAGIPEFRERTVFGLCTAGFFLGIASHLVADALAVPVGDNPLRPFWPVSDRLVAIGLMTPGDPVWNGGLFAAGLAVQAAILYRQPELWRRTAGDTARR